MLTAAVHRLRPPSRIARPSISDVFLIFELCGAFLSRRKPMISAATMTSLRFLSSHLSRLHSQASSPLRFRSSNASNTVRRLTSTAPQQDLKPSDRVSTLVDELSSLTLLEVSGLTEVLRKKLDIDEMPVMAVMMPGMGFSVRGAGKGGGPAKAVAEKAEKTAFDLKLEGFDTAAKIKVIKEVRAFTDLGLKEAKELVEKAPTLLKKGVTKEEAEKIVAKMKEVGAKVTME